MAIGKTRKISICLLAMILALGLMWWQTPLCAVADQGEAKTSATASGLAGNGAQGVSESVRDGLSTTVTSLPKAGVFNEKPKARALRASGMDENKEIKFDIYLFGEDGASGQFKFMLSACDEQGNVLEGVDVYTQEASNGEFAEGKATVSFPITYEGGTTGDCYYLVEEADDDTGGTAADVARYMVHVEVAGGFAGEPEYFLIENGEIVKAAEHAFYNNAKSGASLRFRSMTMAGYSGENGRVSVYPEVQKYLNGSTAALLGGDFKFKLEGNGVERVQSNDITGNVAFYDKTDSEGLVFDEVGTYTYKITEVIPKTATDNGNGTFTDGELTYDGAIITMSVFVTESDGELSAEVVYTGMSQGSAPAFYNERENEGYVKDAWLNLSVSKFDASTHEYVSGATLVVIDAGTGSIVEEWTSRSVAYTTSAKLTPGRRYILRETSAPKGYDKVADTVFNVSPDGKGVSLLSQDATTKLGGSTHIMLYDSPQSSEKVVDKKETRTKASATAQTGDGVPPLLIAVVTIMAFASLTAMLLSRRRIDGSKSKHAGE